MVLSAKGFELVDEDEQGEENDPIDSDSDNSNGGNVDSDSSDDKKVSYVTKEELDNFSSSIDNKLNGFLDNIANTIKKGQGAAEGDGGSGDGDSFDDDYIYDDNGGDMGHDDFMDITEGDETKEAKLRALIRSEASKIARQVETKTDEKLNARESFQRSQQISNANVQRLYPEVFEDGHILQKETEKIYKQLERDPSFKNRYDLLEIAAERAFARSARNGKLDHVRLRKREIYSSDAAGAPRGGGRKGGSNSEPNEKQSFLAERLGIKKDRVKDIINAKIEANKRS